LLVIRYFQVTYYKTISGNFPEKQLSTKVTPVHDFLALEANLCNYKSLSANNATKFYCEQKALKVPGNY